MKRFLLAFLLLLDVVAFAQDSLVRELDSLMQGAYSRGIFNGNVLVVQRGATIYERSFGFADGDGKNMLRAGHRFDVGSISKELNGVAILWLQERGQLSLGDSLAKFFPELPAWAAAVKVQHLINYTSGIPVPGLPDGVNDQLILEHLKTLKTLKAEPGRVYNYSFVDVSLQRQLIERVTGSAYADFVKKNLLLPAGMTNSEIDYPVDGPLMAKAFDGLGRHTPYAAGTKGWLRLTARDLYRWTQALHSHLLLSPASLKILSENFLGGESSLGTAVYEGDRLIWHQHQGSNYNYEAAFYCHLPEDLTIVLMTNQQQMKVWPLKTAILAIMHRQPFGIPKKSLYLGIRDRMLEDVKAGMEDYRQLKQNGQQQYDFSFEIGDLISTAKYLQRRAQYRQALVVLAEAVQLQAKPVDISYGYELMGNCYQALQDQPNALKHYEKAVAVYPANKNAQQMIGQLKGGK